MEDPAQCSVLNSKLFAEKFKESQKGRGLYVDALSSESPYVFRLPNKMDYILSVFNVREPDDPRYNPEENEEEKIYSYVNPVFDDDGGNEKKSGEGVPIRFEWTSTGQRDLMKAREKAEDRDKTDRKLRDETLSRFLSLLSHKSRTLLNNTKGFTEAVRANDLWHIVNKFLPQSHNQVSTSAVQRRTRQFLSVTQDVPLPGFTDRFVQDSDQFRGDWEDPARPGYIKIDALLALTFEEAVRMGSERDILKPALEALALRSGPHRDATLQFSIDSLSSYYMRNKPLESVEQTVGFKAFASQDSCECCGKNSPVRDANAVQALLNPQQVRFFRSYMGSQGAPKFCAACIQHPPKCACGKENNGPFHSVCPSCYRKAQDSTKGRDKGRGRRGEARAHVVTANGDTATASPVISPPVPPPVPSPGYAHPSYPSGPHPHPYHPNQGMLDHYGYPPRHPNVPPPYPSCPQGDDSLSDYSGGATGFFGGAVPIDEKLLCSLVEEVIDPVAFRTGCVAAATDKQYYHVDTGASMHCTDELRHLQNVRTLATPVRIQGIGDSPCFLTHVGDLPWMPTGMRQCFYSRDLGARLISLNYMCRGSRTMYYNVPDHKSMVIFVDGRHFVTCQQSSNNLLPFPALGRGILYPFPGVSVPGAFPPFSDVHGSVPMIGSVPVGAFPCVPSYAPSSNTSTSVALRSAPSAYAVSTPLALRQFTKEQLRRCDLVEHLLDVYCRPSDEVLTASLTFGSLGVLSTQLTPTDVHLNRTLRGPDVNRIQGRYRAPPSKPSRTLPSLFPCQHLVVDQHHSKFPDLFGNTCTIHIVCENTGAFWVESSKSGSAPHLQEALFKFIHAKCNAYGHSVKTIHADADSVFNKLVAPFGSRGMRVILAPPGHHAVRLERYTQTFNERRRMLVASLTFTLPPDLGLSTFTDKHVAHSMRNLTNTVSHPNTPEELVTRARSPVNHATLCRFQEVVAVRMGDQKRAALASAQMVHIQQIPVTEVGVCLGQSDGSTKNAYYVYVHSTRKVVLRRNVTPLGNVIPEFAQRPTPPVKPILPDPYAHLTDPTVPIVNPHQHTTAEGAVVTNSAAEAIPSTPGDDMSLIDGHDDVGTESPVPPIPLVTSSPEPPDCPVPAIPIVESPVVVPTPRTRLVERQEEVVSYSTDKRQSELAPTSPVPDASPVSASAPVPAAVPKGPVIPDVVAPSPPPVSSQSPVKRSFTRRGRGTNRHLHFDTDYAPTQHERKVALIAERARQRQVFSDATWADICSADGAAPRPILPHPHTLRHLCFMAIMKDSLPPSSSFHGMVPSPDLRALSASTTMVVDTSSPSSTEVPALSFSPKDNKEMTYRQGVKCMPRDEVRAAVAKEFAKLFDTHKALRRISQADIRDDAVHIYSSMLLKTKYFGDGSYDRVSARLAANGKNAPESSYGETFAPTADESSTLCAFSAFAAHAVKHQYHEALSYSNFDVKGAFLWIPRSNATQIIMRLPSYVDHPFAGENVEVLKSIYGLKDSNANFDADLRRTIESAGFKSTVDPCIYIKIAPNPDDADIPLRCIVSTHVDDGRAMYNHRKFYGDLIATLEARYGVLSKDDNTTSYTGSTFSHGEGAFQLTQEGYVTRLLQSANLPPGLPTRSTPSDADLFGDTSGTPACDPKTYRQLVGSLIHLLRTRYDIQKEVVHLSSKMSVPTVGDMAKGIKVLQYLKGTPTLGPRYFTSDGPVLFVYVDASYATHHDGRSQTGCSFHIGRHSAPFYVKAGKQTECVSIGSMEAEYVALSQAARKLLEYRYLLADVGFPQVSPTVIYEDNMSAINLAIAPHITRKSRHIHTRHHFIRDLIAQKLAVVQHLATEDMIADFFTKPYPPKRFSVVRDRLFNPS